MKRISIQVNWPGHISATDNDGQSVTVTRVKGNLSDDDLSDMDLCQVRSKLEGDKSVKFGTCKWGDAFAHIQDMLNCSSLDRGWNAKSLAA